MRPALHSTATKARALLYRLLHRLHELVRDPTNLIISVFATIALVICAIELAYPGALFGIYDGDDGVYFGAAVRLSNGVLPYKDFTLVHPPGIALLLAPIALLSHIIGTRDGMALARIFTAVVTGANVVVVGAILRHRGWLSVLIGTALLASFPVAVAADNTLLLEPYVAFFCLLGTYLAFRRGGLGRPRELLYAGIAFGFAGAVKIWAIFPVVVLLVCCWPHLRAALRPFAIGVTCGFVVPCFVFFVEAPSAFVHDIVVSQIERGATAPSALSIGARLAQLSGLGGIIAFNASTGLVVVAFIAVGVAVAVALIATSARSRLELFLVGTLVLVISSQLLSVEFYAHYAYFAAVFFAVLLGDVFSRALRTFARASARLTNRLVSVALRHIELGAAAVVLVVAGLLVPGNIVYAWSFLAASHVEDPSATISAAIIPGSCVISLDSVFSLNANRFTPDGPGCPALDDSFGTWLAIDPKDLPPTQSPPYNDQLIDLWAGWLREADYFIYEPGNNRVPWTTPLLDWFNSSYRLVAVTPYAEVYENRNPGFPLPVVASSHGARTGTSS
jgi:alpha-1,2-mannosyltransferase